MTPGDIDPREAYDAAIDAVLLSAAPRQTEAIVNLFAVHEAFMARYEAKQGYPVPAEPHTPRHEVALTVLQRFLGVTDERIALARRRLEAGQSSNSGGTH